MVAILGDMCWQYGRNTSFLLDNACNIELINTAVFSCYSYVLFLVILYIRCSPDSVLNYESIMPFGQSARAVLSIALLVAHLGDWGVALISERGYLELSAMLISWLLSQFLYAKLEKRKEPRCCCLLLTGSFWLACGITKGLQLYHYVRAGLGVNLVKPHTTGMSSTICYALAFNDFITVLCEMKLVQQQEDASPVENCTYRHDSANWYSKVTFCWLTPLLKNGYSNPLELEGLGSLPYKEKATNQYELIKSLWSVKNNGLWMCYIKLYWKNFLSGGILKLLGDCIGFVSPLGIATVIQYIADERQRVLDGRIPRNVGRLPHVTTEEFFSNGYVMAMIVFISCLAQGSFSQASTHVLNVEGIRLKTALQSLVYCKTLKLNTVNRKKDQDKAGSTINLLSEDVYNIMSGFWIGHYIWAIPLKIVILMCLLYSKLGISTIIGASTCIGILFPLQFIIGKKMSRNNKGISEWSDCRLWQTNEVLQGVRLLKLCAWENDFYERILNTRYKELKLLDKDSFYWAVMTFLTHASSVLITLVTFVSFYFLEGGTLTAANVFSGIALFNQLTVPLFIFPVTLPIIISALVSTKRVESFLRLSETSNIIPQNDKEDKTNTKNEQRKSFTTECRRESIFGLMNISEMEEDEEVLPISEGSSAVVTITEAEFSWSDCAARNLKVNKLAVPRGKLTIIVGKTGSGKSSLLSSLLGEMTCVSGSIVWEKGCTLAYVSQTPWLLNTSLRDNILFGRAFRERRFNRVISATALQPDINILPEKDLTMIGERGISLSGGQRQRIAVARALYSRANVVILDDPLSALDYQVARHVFDEGIRKLVNKQKRTVIMSSHSRQLVSCAHQVVTVENGVVHTRSGLNEVESTEGEWHGVSCADHGRTARERWQLVRLVSRIGHQLRTQSNCDEIWNNHQVESLLFIPFRKRLGTFSGSRYLAHDLLLPTDECEEEEITERRHRVTQSNNLERSHKAVLRASSLQAGSTVNYPMYPVQRQSSSPNINPGSRSRTFDGVPSQRGGLLRQLFSLPTQKDLHGAFQTQASSKPSFPAKSSCDITTFELPERHVIQRLPSTTSECSEDFNEDDDNLETTDWCSPQTAQEEREYGKIPRRIYLTYLQACTPVLGILYIASAVSWQGLRVGTDFWLSKWSDKSDLEDNSEAFHYLLVYSALSAASVILSLLSNGLGQYCGCKARKDLHDRMLKGLLKCPVRFFELTPLGRIMNRFSTDLAVIDKKIGTSIQRLLQFVLLCLSAVLINSAITPWFLILAIPLCIVYYAIQKFYRCSSRELQRLDSIARSPILSHFSETLAGIETIRAFSQQKRFIAVFFSKIDTHTNAFLIFNSANRWLGIALDYLGGLIVFLAMLVSLLMSFLFPNMVTPSLVGLAINYTLLVPIYLNWVVKFLSDMEMYMGAVERVTQYANAIPEDYKTEYNIPLNWPLKGDIKFQNISLRYDNQREPVITNLSLHIPTGQKVGICGRTGSGKSSLMMSLFSMVHICEGKILLDGEDISKLPLHALRTRLSVIPQDVIMFSGTIRENLDIRCKYTDEEIWNSLELAQMKEMVAEDLGGLDGKVWEGGVNFSAGQRQLFCLARAVLHSAVCLIMDEATSSLDLAAEKKLLRAASTAFNNRTIITIAHHLHSLLDYDRIIVLESGRIIEDGSPSSLLSRSMGIFSTMLKSADSSA